MPKESRRLFLEVDPPVNYESSIVVNVGSTPIRSILINPNYLTLRVAFEDSLCSFYISLWLENGSVTHIYKDLCRNIKIRLLSGQKGDRKLTWLGF